MPSFTEFHWALPNFNEFYWVLLGFTGFHWVSLDFLQVLPSFGGRSVGGCGIGGRFETGDGVGRRQQSGDAEGQVPRQAAGAPRLEPLADHRRQVGRQRPAHRHHAQRMVGHAPLHWIFGTRHHFPVSLSHSGEFFWGEDFIASHSYSFTFCQSFLGFEDFSGFYHFYHVWLCFLELVDDFVNLMIKVYILWPISNWFGLLPSSIVYLWIVPSVLGFPSIFWVFISF